MINKTNKFKNFWTVTFGYSLVGFFSLGAGFATYVTEFGIIFDILVIVKFIYITTIVVFGIFLFCYSYAKVYFEKYIDKEYTKKLKDTSLCLAIVFFCALFIITYFSILNDVLSGISFLIYSMLVFLIYYFCYFKYSKQLSFLPQEAVISTRYTLILPSLLIVGCSLYIGASACFIFKSQWLYFIPLLVLFFFLILLCRINIKCKDVLKRNTRIYILFSTVTILCVYIIPSNIQLKSIHYLVFSVFCSIYLAIYESWYILVNRKKWPENEKSIIYVVSSIITLSPLFILTLFPYINFGFIFWCYFIIIHPIIQIIWFKKILSFANDHSEKNKNTRNILIRYRAILGFMTLIIIIIDKILYNPIQFPSSTTTSTLLTIGGLYFSGFVAIIIIIIKKNAINVKYDTANINSLLSSILTNRMVCLKIQSYLLFIPIISVILAFIFTSDVYSQFKSILTIIGCFILSLFALAQWLWVNHQEKRTDIDKNIDEGI